ncbi:MAG: hypothetical protein ABI488_05920 [Polyangiaceae bacterium]
MHGRTKVERAQDALQKKKLESAADHARLETPAEADADNESPPKSS